MLPPPDKDETKQIEMEKKKRDQNRKQSEEDGKETTKIEKEK